MRRLRYRPFGLGASAVEVLIGLVLLRSTVAASRDGGSHWSGVLAVAWLFSAILLVSGALGVTVYLRARMRNDRAR